MLFDFRLRLLAYDPEFFAGRGAGVIPLSPIALEMRCDSEPALLYGSAQGFYGTT